EDMAIEGFVAAESVSGNLRRPVDARAEVLAPRATEQVVEQMALESGGDPRLDETAAVERVRDDDRPQLAIEDLWIRAENGVVAEEAEIRRVHERLMAIPS